MMGCMACIPARPCPIHSTSDHLLSHLSEFPTAPNKIPGSNRRAHTSAVKPSHSIKPKGAGFHKKQCQSQVASQEVSFCHSRGEEACFSVPTVHRR